MNELQKASTQLSEVKAAQDKSTALAMEDLLDDHDVSTLQRLLKEEKMRTQELLQRLDEAAKKEEAWSKERAQWEQAITMMKEQEQASSFIDPSLRRQTARHREQVLDAEQRFWLDAALQIHRRLLNADADDQQLQRDLDGLRPAGGRPG